MNAVFLGTLLTPSSGMILTCSSCAGVTTDTQAFPGFSHDIVQGHKNILSCSNWSLLLLLSLGALRSRLCQYKLKANALVTILIRSKCIEPFAYQFFAAGTVQTVRSTATSKVKFGLAEMSIKELRANLKSCHRILLCHSWFYHLKKLGSKFERAVL